jgi:hypothetical protein
VCIRYIIRITIAADTGADVIEGILTMIIRLVAIAMYKTSIVIVSFSHLLLSNTVTKINCEHLTLCE